MNNYLLNLFYKILHIGIKPSNTFIDKHQIQNANLGGVISFLFSITATIATAYYLPYPYVFIPLIGSFAYLLALVFNYYGLHLLANINIWAVSLMMFFWMAGAYGESSNAYLLFIVVEMMSIFNFEQKRKWVLLTSSLPIILAMITYLTDFSLFLIPDLNQSQLDHIHPVIFFSVLLACGVTVWTHRLQVREHVRLLEKKYKEAEVANSELKKANEELDRFVYSVSHDLRAPITSVMGLLELCESDKENIDTYLALQAKSINRLDGFIKDILHYARNSRLELMPVFLDFPVIIKEIFESQAYSHSAIEIEMKVSSSGDAQIHNDRFRFDIIVGNIISNAIRYRNPKVNSYLEFDIKLLPKEAKIMIKDNGIGIPARHLPHVFQMFYRANAKGSGSGLGLYIVKEAVHKINGSIEISSTEGEGTVFSLSIPHLAPMNHS